MLVNPIRLSSWRTTSLLGVGLTAVLYLVFFVSLPDVGEPLTHLSSHASNSAHGIASAEYITSIVTYWKDLATTLESARPQCPPINVTQEPMSPEDRNWEPLKEKKRPDRLILPKQDEVELMRAHRQMRVAARRLGPALPAGEGMGIVTTGGLDLFPVLLVSLRILRRTGCTLPVQIFVSDQTEYQEVKTICEDILLSLNARCYAISDVYSQAEAAPPEHFQFKMLAILFSSFKHILFLDADAFPVHDPTPLFHAPPYTTHGLVTWPGFYGNAASAHFYHIAGIPEPPISRGSESGQLLLNKHHHRESIPMMVYYNYYGPEYYYPLQAQGGPGQGDKETFSAGAVAVDAPGPFYGVKTPVQALGIHVNGEYIFAGAGQADPIQDYLYGPPHPNHIQEKYLRNETDKIGAEDPEHATARAFFVHTVSQRTKLHPLKLLGKGGLAFDEKKNWHRIWGPEESVREKFGYDVEKVMWECVAEEACRMEENACLEIREYYETVFGSKLELV